MQDFSRQVAIAIRWLPLILVCAIAAGGLAYVYFDGQPRVYQATGQLVVNPGPEPSLQNTEVAALRAARYARDAGSLPMARRMIDQLGLEEGPRSFSERISTDIDPDGNILALSVTGSDPEEARNIAQALGRTLITNVRDELVTSDVRHVDSAIARNQALITQLNQRRLNLRRKANKTFEDRLELASLPREIADLEGAILQMRPASSTGVRYLLEWFEQPSTPAVPIEPRPAYWGLLALIVGGMLGVAIAFVVEYLRRVNKIRDERDLELATGLPSLGVVCETRRDRGQPLADRLVLMRYPRSDGAEAVRDVIARMGFSGGATRSLAVTSATPSDATGLVAANIALAYAEAGRNVILVDADYRAPRMHSFFRVQNDRGLTTILTDSNVPLGWATMPTAHPRLGLMPSGPPPRETAEPLGQRQLNALLRRLLQAADLVVFHSPAMQGHLDAAVLADQLDAVMLVVPHDSKADETEEAARSLQIAEAEFVGAVLYRQVRRARKGAKVDVVPAPAGWGPTWPGLYDAPAQIPAVAQAGSQPRPAPVPVTATAEAGPPPFQANRRAQGTPASGPYAVPFRPEGVPADGPPAPGPQGPPPGTSASVGPAPGRGGQPTAPAQAAFAPGRPLQAVGPGVGSDAQASPHALSGAEPSHDLPFAATFQAAPPGRPAQAQSGPPPDLTDVTGPLATPPPAPAAERNGNGVAPAKRANAAASSSGGTSA